MPTPNHKPHCQHCGVCPKCGKHQFPWRKTWLRLIVDLGIEKRQATVIIRAMLADYNARLACRNSWHK